MKREKKAREIILSRFVVTTKGRDNYLVFWRNSFKVAGIRLIDMIYELLGAAMGALEGRVTYVKNTCCTINMRVIDMFSKVSQVFMRLHGYLFPPSSFEMILEFILIKIPSPTVSHSIDSPSSTTNSRAPLYPTP